MINRRFEIKTRYSGIRTQRDRRMVPRAKSNIATPDMENKIVSMITRDNSDLVERLIDKKKSRDFSIKRSPSTQPSRRKDLFEFVATF